MTGKVENDCRFLHDLLIEKNGKVLEFLPKLMLTEKEIEVQEAWVRKYDETSEKRWRCATSRIGSTACSL